MELDLYINVDPPDHEIGLASTTLTNNKNVHIIDNFLIPIGGILL